MNGPSHFSQGEERMRASDRHADRGLIPQAMHEAAMAQAHFLAALVTLGAGHVQADSLSWQEATEQ